MPYPMGWGHNNQIIKLGFSAQCRVSMRLMQRIRVKQRSPVSAVESGPLAADGQMSGLTRAVELIDCAALTE